MIKTIIPLLSLSIMVMSCGSSQEKEENIDSPIEETTVSPEVQKEIESIDSTISEMDEVKDEINKAEENLEQLLDDLE